MRYISKNKCIILSILIFLMLTLFVSQAVAKKNKRIQKKQQNQIQEQNQKWYIGGNLHDKKMIDWKKATQHNKIATCGDILVATYKKGHLKMLLYPHDLDTIKKYSEILAFAIDEAVKANPNDKDFLACPVSVTSVVAMAHLGWLK